MKIVQVPSGNVYMTKEVMFCDQTTLTIIPQWNVLGGGNQKFKIQTPHQMVGT